MVIHFICRGNANRSIIAEAYLNSLGLSDITVISSGTRADFYRVDNEKRIPGIIERLSKHGLSKYAKTIPDQLTQIRANNGEITVCMNKIVADESSSLVSFPSDPIIWNIDDTGEGKRIIQPGEDEFKYTEETYIEIKQKVDELVKNLSNLI